MTPSQTLFEEAQSILVGGVNSPVRAFGSVSGNPIFIKEGQGAHLISEDNKRYIDYVLSWGPLILGHAHPETVKAIQDQATHGTSFGAPCQLETQLAQHIQTHVPMMEKIRFVNSGTEATMSAVRLARGVTKRDKIIKFNGCYHGHSDGFLVAAGSGNLTLGTPDSAGVPASIANDTIVLDYNDTEALIQAFNNHGKDIAAVIIEPITGNMGMVFPTETFIQTLRQQCTTHDSLLIFDEVMTGFRVALGGAQALLNVTPDITVLGKVIGGGLPCAAYGASKTLMSHLAPEGPVYQAGTLSGNPLAMRAGIATLTALSTPGVFAQIAAQTSTLINTLSDHLHTSGYPATIQGAGTMFCLFFSPKNTMQNLTDVKTCNLTTFKTIHQTLLNNGIYFPPSQFEACFLSSAHTEQDIEHTTKTLIQVLTP